MAVTKIQTVTVGSGGSTTIDFTSIPGTYTDLLIDLSARNSAAGNADVYAQFNGVTTSTYTMRRLYGTGSGGGNADAVSSASATGFRVGRSLDSNYTSSTFSNCSIYIPNYAGSTTKSATTDQVEENNNASSSLQLITGCTWTGTAAITQITLKQLDGNNFAQYSSATLYGVTKGSSGGVTVS